MLPRKLRYHYRQGLFLGIGKEICPGLQGLEQDYQILTPIRIIWETEKSTYRSQEAVSCSILCNYVKAIILHKLKQFSSNVGTC